MWHKAEGTSTAHQNRPCYTSATSSAPCFHILAATHSPCGRFSPPCPDHPYDSRAPNQPAHLPGDMGGEHDYEHAGGVGFEALRPRGAPIDLASQNIRNAAIDAISTRPPSEPHCGAVRRRAARDLSRQPDSTTDGLKSPCSMHFCRLRPQCCRYRQTSKSGPYRWNRIRNWPTSSNFGQIATKFGQTRLKFGRNVADIGKIWSNSSQD